MIAPEDAEKDLPPGAEKYLEPGASEDEDSSTEESETASSVSSSGGLGGPQVDAALMKMLRGFIEGEEPDEVQRSRTASIYVGAGGMGSLLALEMATGDPLIGVERGCRNKHQRQDS